MSDNRTTNRKTGDMGEAAAKQMLVRKGYSIIAANYSCRYGEIDIIAGNSEYIVFAEVKTVELGGLQTPAMRVDKRKQKKIIRTAVIYLQENDTGLQPRFDIIGVVYDRKTGMIVDIKHYEDAFDASDIGELF